MLRLHYGELNAHDMELEGFTGGEFRDGTFWGSPHDSDDNPLALGTPPKKPVSSWISHMSSVFWWLNPVRSYIRYEKILCPEEHNLTLYLVP